MNTKPTYKELEKTIAELQGSKKAIQRSEERLKEAERIAKIGHWELDLVTNTLYWSDEIYRIIDSDPQKFGATYEAFLNSVHPEDRKAVDKTFRGSLNKRISRRSLQIFTNQNNFYLHQARSIFTLKSWKRN